MSDEIEKTPSVALQKLARAFSNVSGQGYEDVLARLHEAASSTSTLVLHRGTLPETVRVYAGEWNSEQHDRTVGQLAEKFAELTSQDDVLGIFSDLIVAENRQGLRIIDGSKIPYQRVLDHERRYVERHGLRVA